MSERDDASIDDLLGHDDEPGHAGRSAGFGPAWLVKAGLGAGLLAAVVVLALRSGGVGVPYVLAFTCLFAPIALRRILRQVAPQPLPRARVAGRHPEEIEYRWGAMDGLRLSLAGWQIRLDWGNTDLTRFARTTQPALAEVVDERLRQRHGVTMAGDPVRARALLGDPLWALLTTPVHRPLSPRQLSVLIERIERL